jgi:hypothetical protein
VTGALSTTWLSARLGRGPQELDADRREGRLLGLRAGDDYEFPAWQFGPEGDVLPAVPRVIALARTAGLTDERLGELLHAPSGLGSNRRLADSLVEGNLDHVLTVVLSAPRAV